MWWSKGKSRVTEGAQALASPMIMSLEPRMLFDGAVAATVADAAQPDAHPTADAAKTPTADQPADTHAPQGQVDATEAAVPGKSVVFVDSRVKDSASLLEGVAPGTQVVQLDASKDGLQQIADYLDTHQGISSVQIIAHGNAGDLWLGNSYLSADNVQARSEVLAQIGQDMNAGGDILIYGCYTAEGERGLSLVDSLAQLTGRDVAASDDRTGLGGDWDLEIATGNIESANVLSNSAMSEYQWGLATWTATNNLNSGIGSLRAALGSAQNGDIVTFNTSMTVALTQVLVVDRNVTIDGDLNNDNVADVTLDGQYRTQIINVTSGTTATLDGLVITRGMVAGNGGNGGDDALVSQGGGIYNAGTLTLRNVTVTANAASGGGGGGGVTPQYAGGGGGGGGAITGGTGGKGGDTLNSTGSNGTAGQGGAGGGFFNIGGRGGSTTGGAGGAAYPGYSTGSAGGTATSGGLSIGGGGGGDGYDDIGGAGGGAVGGIYNDTGATLRIIGNSVISNNVGAGGGGGGGGAGGSYLQAGGAGGVGVGAIWNKGSILITAANFAALAGNVGGSGVGGTSAGSAGVSPASVANVYGDGGTINTNYVPDETPPTATVVVANTNLNSGGTSTVTITFSEAVTGLTAADLTVQNGSVGTLTSGDGGITWTGTLTAASNIADTTNIITLNNTGVADLAGNAGVGTTDSNNYIVNDTVAPTASIVVSDTALRIGETSTVTITFSEAVSGFTTADMTVANGTLSGLSSSDGGITWTATLTPDAAITDTSNLIVLNNTGVADLNGNAGVGTTNSNNYAIDTQRPTATIVVSDTALRVGETSVVTITFSEAVSGFTTADLTVANGTVTGLSSSDGGITWTGTLTPSASVSDTTNLITLDNTGIADLSGNAGSGTTDSNNYAIDTARPTATIVVADTALNIGETSLVTITFSEAVTGFTLADLTVANGSLSGLSSSDGGITWTATLTPSASTTDATNLIILANTGVADAAGNTGSGTTSSNNYAVDTQRPTATIVVADNALSVGETSLVTITFNEAVTGFTTADLTVANGTITGLSSGDGGITWTGTLTPSASVSDTTNLVTLDNTGITDSAGNAGSGTTDSNNYAIDTVRPTATIVVADTAIAVGETSLVTITFSEPVTGFTLADLTVANGSLSGLSTSDNITYTATFTPSAGISDTTNLITLNNTGVVDGAGNVGSGTTDSNNYVVDTLRPTATIVVADTALSVGETSLVTITFSEAVTGFDNSDLSVANGTLSAVSSSDGGITWTATFTPALGVSDTSNLIVLNNTGVSDAAGNTGTGTTNSNNYQVDTNVPTATIVIADTTLSIGETTLVTVTFNSAVSGFDNADLTVSNGTLSTMSSTDGGVTWTATFTPSASISDTSNVITLDNTGLINAAGNAGVGTTDSNNYAVDTVRPTATIVVADTAIAAGETSLVTITFNEAVTAFTSADLTVANGVISGLSSSDGGITWTATFTPTSGVTDTSNVISLNSGSIVDLAGNLNVGGTDSNNYALDTERPTATIVLADANLSVGETSLVTITFSEAVTGFTNADLSVANGTLSAVSSSDGGLTWTATFTPTLGVRDTSNLIILDNTGVSDAAGNTGAGTTNSTNYAIDTQVPTATIVVADTSLSIGETSQVTITFNEAVSGFDNSDLTISNGTLSNVSSSDGGVTWTATFTPSASISDTSNLITLDNTGVVNVSGNAGVGTTDSNNYAVDTVRPTATIVVADTAIAAGETSLVTITFNEAVTGFTDADLSVANGTLSGLSSSDGGITWTATFTPTSGVTDTSNVITLANSGVADLAGNAGSGTTDSNNYSVDSQRPSATIVLSDSVLKPGETAQVTITFSEAVTGFSNADLSVANGTLSAVSSSDGGLTWTATFTPTLGVTDTSNLITLDNTGVSDAAGNTGTGTTDSANYAVETQVPTATIVVADSALRIGETSQVTITFSEAVSGFDNSDLTISNGTLSNVSSTDGGVTWTATFTPSASITDTSNLISLDTSGVVNASGNSGVGVVDSNNYAIDTVRPGATITVGDTTLGIGQSTTVTISFTEAVSGFDLSDLSVANGVLSNLASSDGGLTWTATLTPTVGVNDATNLILLDAGNVQDLAGNAGVGIAISANYALDATRPTATIVVADPNLTVGETTQVTFTFSEAVTDFDLSDLSVTNGELTNLTTSDGGKTWTATFTPTVNLTDPSNFIALDTSNVSDQTGNAGASVAVSNNYAIDTVVPNDVKPPPEFLTTDPVTVIPPSEVPLQPIVFTPPTGNLGSPLGFPPLFEQRDVGGGLRPIGDIFINHGALAPSYIAQVFSTDAAGDGSGQGFLGFGGGDGGVFGTSTLSTLFNQDSGSEGESMDAFDSQSMQGGDVSQGLRGTFGAPTLGQQLQHLKDTEQRQVDSLASALQQVGISQVQA
ncbi:Ig-like domain-containing protein [Pseudomonas brassicacearum]|uniref:Ig-like domain-containing protein n=1 Tax=Pseudomonas brassicacearum TaxID=930166 RepID=UPI000721E80B|nr:Ig-like domain-containing protein [Pseudomonas brassicacearum]ALQ00793.1 Fibronectin type III domain protein [Pseudomonas brassicacearum]AOS40043.1 glycosyl hydrolase [Pseudomonas brassicacearum]ROM99348.1 glycosyl hydrolase [Pseudomonas brassicacearum]RON05744.1 glycosyl hydrolase [Pseudomonas brassicacearum]